MTRLALKVVAVGAAIALLGVVSFAIAGDGTRSFDAGPLIGYEENPDISTTGNGSFEARLNEDGTSLHYELSYTGLEGNVTQAHVHFGKYAVNGGISFFLCSNLNAATDDNCPQSGTVEGDIEAADVIGPGPVVGPPAQPGQGIEPGALNEILAAMRAGHAYANVHTTKWPGGEIRGQINDGSRGGDD